MKKLIFSLFIMMALSGFIFADKNVAVSDLPTTITDFMKTYFPESIVDSAEYDDGKYEIWFSVEKDNNVVKGEAEFSRKGDWKNLEFYLGVPETLLPEPVLTTLRQNFSDQAIVSLERDKRGFELTLSDSTEIDISDEGKILDLDKEHRHRKFDKNKSDKAKKFKEPKQDSSATMDSVDAL